LTTRVALITGCGKRDGMGRAIALRMAASGVAVVVTDKQATGVLNRRQEVVGVTDESWGGVDSLVDEIAGLGGTAMSQLGDISVAEDARRMVDTAAAWRGRLDILVNGAGAPQGLDRQDIEEVPIEVFDFVIAVNLRGTYLMSRFAVPHMRSARWGRIINISSQAGQVPAAMSTAYSASKAGVLGFTRALSADVAPWGITVNAISPGMVATSRALLSIDPSLDADARGGAVRVPGRHRGGGGVPRLRWLRVHDGTDAGARRRRVRVHVRQETAGGRAPLTAANPCVVGSVNRIREGMNHAVKDYSAISG
jgi:3-oxoacyl-[acyl-carrier protein] reductase